MTNSKSTEFTEVSEMISELYKLKSENSMVISVIKNFDLLIEALKELDMLIEMTSVKSAIISQLHFLIIKQLQNKKDDEDQIFEGHMLHTVIYGPPGVGKTKVGIILSKIWLSLTLIKSSMVTSSTSTSPDIYDTIINKLEQKNKLTLERLELVKDNLLAQQDGYNTFRKEITKLTDNHRFLSPTQKDLIITTYNDSTKYLEASIKLITDEIIKEKAIVNQNEKVFGVATNTMNTDTIIQYIKKLKNTNFSSSTALATSSSASSLQIKIVSRPDFVAEYLGQTAIKTLDLLKSNIGKVLFIDEAYSLINSERDSYGMEALTVLNQFMSEHPYDIVVILAGYKDLLEKTVFEKQPGLKSRCTWFFEVLSYTPIGLSQIFTQQLSLYGWNVDVKIRILDFFKENFKAFPAFGRDTSRFAFYCKLTFSNEAFKKLIISDKTEEENIKIAHLILSKNLTSEVLKKAFDVYQQNRIQEDFNINLSLYL